MVRAVNADLPGLGPNLRSHAIVISLRKNHVFQLRAVFFADIDFNPGKIADKAAFIQQSQRVFLAQVTQHLAAGKVTARRKLGIEIQAKRGQQNRAEKKWRGNLPQTDSAGLERRDFPIRGKSPEVQQHRREGAHGNHKGKRERNIERENF